MTPLKTLRRLGTAMALSMVVAAGTAAAQDTRLSLQTLQGGEDSFNVASVLVTGKTEAVLIDAQFTRANAHRLVAMVLESRKKLTTIYVSHGDPDYYFGLETLHAAFPGARIVATAETVKHIQQTVDKKMELWGPRLGANGPVKPLVPEVLSGNVLRVDGETLEISVPEASLPDRSYVWVPSLKAIIGGVLNYNDLHLWIADAASPASRLAWIRALDAMEARQPAIVIAGHAKPGSAQDLSAVRFSRDYLRAYEPEAAKAANSAALISAMKARYPQAGLGIALDIGAKVVKGEMKW